MNGIYEALAARYDALNSGVDYDGMADFFLTGCARFSRMPRTALDLCCGTGSMLLRLARRGLDMTGADLSPEMLAVARKNADSAGLSERVLLLCQDMRRLELYGTVDAICCTLDSVNHLSSYAELVRVFTLVANYLEYGGIFFFDINSRYKYENVYGTNAYILEDEGLYCGWQNYYDAKSGRAEFLLSVFEEGQDGAYRRTDAVQRERFFSERTVKRALAAAGLELCGEFGELDFSVPEKDTERLYWFAKRPEPAKTAERKNAE